MFSGRLPHKVASIARVQSAHRQQHRQVGRVEIRIPCRFATDPRAGTQIALDQRWHRRLLFCWQIIPEGCHWQRATRENTVFKRTHVCLEAIIQAGCGMAAVCHADAGAADQVLVSTFQHVAGEAGPEQGDRGAAAIIRMHAGTADFHQSWAQVLQAGQVKLVFRVVAADALGVLWRKYPVGADDFGRVLITDDQVLAKGS